MTSAPFMALERRCFDAVRAEALAQEHLAE
jgi:hypothetical protein